MDLISRKAAIDAIGKDIMGGLNYESILKDMPSAQSDDQFEHDIHAMFDHIWDCEIDHPIFQDTVGELMMAVIQCYKKSENERKE